MEGDSGFVNLMRMKRAHFHSIRPKLMEKIDERAEKGSAFREELFDKLYTFFHHYFCESGSIYFRHLPAFSKVYERVYADGQDVALSWKTQMLYYVKSDVLVRSMPVELNEEGKPQNTRRFYFDASEFEHKKNNERREFVFTFDEVKREKQGRVIHLKVSYSQRGTKTKTDEIIKQSRNANVSLTDDQLQKAFGVFRRQTEADFFINKDARGFLREQFDLWTYQYIFKEETIFEEKRIKQIQAIKDIAYNIIDFIAQFEDELRRVWEKPKFVRNVNYVVTLDKLINEILKKIANHEGAKAQIAEWRELGMVNDKFSMKTIFNGQKIIDGKNSAHGDYKFLPIDTKYFKDLELEILDGLGNLNETLDGELVHSENWQVLNSLRGRYKEKVKCIYIDPPFNLDSSDQFDYRTNYKDSCWATLLENRLSLAHDLLSNDGGIFVRCDENGNWIARCVLDTQFRDQFKNGIFIKRGKQTLGDRTMYATACDTLFFYSKTKEFIFSPFKRKRYKGEAKGSNLLMNGERQPRERDFVGPDGVKVTLLPPPNQHWKFKQEAIDEMYEKGILRFANSRKGFDSGIVKILASGKVEPVNYVPSFIFDTDKTVDSNWTDISGYSADWGFGTENSEELLMRSISTCTNGFVLDFFSGSGTTQAVAQKLRQKWLGVEMGENFYTVILPRMKKVVWGYQSGISKKTKYKGGGFYKYYTLEQYEETLKNTRFQDGEQLELDSTKSPFEQYVFFGDDKLAHAVKPKKDGNLEINLKDLYPDIDIAESLSNILGKQIRKRTANMVTFADGSTEKTDPSKMTEEEKRHFVSLIKSYLWWGK